jgi:lipoprotein-anchoring transpeptidase ErfK/SrfK
MKTAILVSCLVAGGSLVLKNTDTRISATASLPAVKTTTKSKRASANKTLPKSPIRIIVDKSSYELYVYDAEGWFATYPVVFGNSSLEDKKVEGDRNTPEGTFQIANKRIHDKWDRYMGLNYPTQESLTKFNERKRRGEIPANASPGGGIGIHGTWPHEDFVIDRYKNWTNGCISLKNEDVEDLYSYVPIGTPITIRK